MTDDQALALSIPTIRRPTVPDTTDTRHCLPTQARPTPGHVQRVLAAQYVRARSVVAVDDETQRLEAWWVGLGDEQQAELLPLEEGDTLPSVNLAGLTKALGVGPAGVKWEGSGEGYAFHVDNRLGGFLAVKRAETGGG